MVYTVRIDRTEDSSKPLFLVAQVTVRTIDKRGQLLLVPQIDTDTWWTSLDTDSATIVRLYHEHGTMEQFHSEFKTDLAGERLPSGKFEVNDLVLSLSMLTFNMLRLIGQESLEVDDCPLTQTVKRRRIAAVIKT